MTILRHCPKWVPPFGYLRVNGYLLLSAAFRSLSRPSSAPSAKAFTLCPSLLGLLGISLYRVLLPHMALICGLCQEIFEKTLASSLSSLASR